MFTNTGEDKDVQANKLKKNLEEHEYSTVFYDWWQNPMYPSARLLRERDLIRLLRQGRIDVVQFYPVGVAYWPASSSSGGDIVVYAAAGPRVKEFIDTWQHGENLWIFNPEKLPKEQDLSSCLPSFPRELIVLCSNYYKAKYRCVRYKNSLPEALYLKRQLAS